MSSRDPQIRRAIHERASLSGLMGDLDTAEGLLRGLIASDPNDVIAARSLSLVLLSRGNFSEGASLYDARLAAPRPQLAPKWPYPLWRGEPLDRKQVVIWPEQGLGDQIMFARFAPVLRQRGCEVTLMCRPALERLFRDSLDVRVIGAAGTVEFPDPDVWIWSNSLLTALVRDERDIPGAPYLRSTTSVRQAFRVGVATRGNPTHINDEARSLPAHLAEELLAMPGCASLLPEHTGARDFAETAAIVSGLDLVISVDTSIAHLAGAMGKPCWILLPFAGTDWRWMRGRRDSPWYPSARLFRQPALADWGSVMAQVKAELVRFPAA